jgi:GlpG protein
MRLGPLTTILIGISVAVAIWSRLGANEEVLSHLFISASNGGFSVPEIAHGEVWRLITPIFIHFGIAHLLFNMLWLKDLGTAIERVAGGASFLELVLFSGVSSNFAQFAFKGPYFGGMSGVVYALFGYVWMRAKYDPGSGLRLHSNTVLWMIGWFVVCMTGAIGPVANVAHGVGLAVGMAWGFASAKTSPVRSEDGAGLGG